MKRSTVLALASLSAIGLVFIPSLIPAGPTSSLDASGLLASGQLFIAAGVIFLGGFLTSLTPCVYPLIPITVGVFGARQAESKGRALLLTTSYVVGMGLVFSALGVFAALSGRAFGSVLGNTWVIVGLAVFMTVLASSMFGAFELALPSGLATKLNGVGGGGVIGALLMGSVAGFLAAPCTGPVLTGVLTWVAQKQDPVIGGGLLFIYAMGIGVPFFLIGVFTMRLPKSGVWMEWVKSIFGIALLAMAVGYLRDAFPGLRDFIVATTTTLGRSAAISLGAALAFVGVVLGAVHLSFKEGRQWLPKSIGITVVLVAFLMRMAAPNVVAPVDPTLVAAGGGGEFVWSLTYKAEENSATFDEVLAKAKADCKPVMIDFFAEWCAACKELDHLTYVAPEVIAESKRFVTVKVDGTNESDVTDQMYKRFGVKGLPTVAFIDPMGEVLQNPRVAGFLPPAEFLPEMRKIGLATCSRTP
ncbi:MAG: cytochrome c biogenesis protein CcdA [Archangium sp.]|nr:cytochrome c biogenesis protein CcdA [Archangium sp.]